MYRSNIQARQSRNMRKVGRRTLDGRQEGASAVRRSILGEIWVKMHVLYVPTLVSYYPQD